MNLGDVELGYSWCGRLPRPPDGLAYLGEHSRYRRCRFALGYGGNGITYSAHPLTTAIALAALDIYEREGVVDNVSENEAYFAGKLNELRRVQLVSLQVGPYADALRTPPRGLSIADPTGGVADRSSPPDT